LTRSFLRLERATGDVVLSALKRAEDRASVIVRLFNPGTTGAHATLALGVPVSAAYEVNLLEERRADLRVDGEVVAVTLGPHQIRTIELA